jgi:hypothetical protein
LSIQLRANREDLILPDSHGHIWTEMVTLTEDNAEFFGGTTKIMEERIAKTLGLHGQAKIPVRRLGTLWRNASWRPMITEWCQFPLGQSTFNISTFEWMSSCRIDEVSFFEYYASDNVTLPDLSLVDLPNFGPMLNSFGSAHSVKRRRLSPSSERNEDLMCSAPTG